MVASPPYSRSGNSVLRHHAHAWWPHHLIPVEFGELAVLSAPCSRMVASPPYSCPEFSTSGSRMVASVRGILRHHAHAWWPHHLIPVRNSVLRHHAHAWWPHHLIPVRGIQYFGTMLTHGGLTTLFPFGEFSTSAPCSRMVASPPYSRSGNSVLRHHAHAWWPHHLIPVRGIQYFGTMLTHGGLTTLFHVLIQYFVLTHGGLTTLFLSSTSAPCSRMVASPPYPFGEFSTSAPCSRMVASPPYSRSGNSVLRHHAHAWWPHHLIPVQNSVLRHHAHAWWPHHLIPVQNSPAPATHGGLTTLLPFGEFSTSAPCSRMVASPPYSCPGNSVLRHHAHAWCPHHLIPVYPPPVRGGEYFANNLHCWAHLNQALPQCGARRFGLTPPNSCTSLYRSHENNGHSVKK